MRRPRRNGGSLAGLAAVGAVGFVLAFSVIVGAGGGYLLDRWLHTNPFLTVLGLLLGSIAGFVRVIQIANKWSED